MSKKYTAEKIVENGIASGLAMTFAEGEPMTILLSSFPAAMVSELAVHGLKQKLGDIFASKDAKEGREHVERVIEGLKAGDFSIRVAGSAKATVLAQAISRISGQDVSEVVETLNQLDDETVKGLRQHPDIKLVMQEIRTEKEREKAAAARGDAPSISSIFAKG